jgi:Patatin-like phospholipase
LASVIAETPFDTGRWPAPTRRPPVETGDPLEPLFRYIDGLLLPVLERSVTLEELRGKRIGLVLSGGGAKGAYQIGCWRVLRECGITKFAAVSGSSVGALTAMLVALDKFECADSLWRTLRFGTIVGLKPLRFLVLPIWIFVAVSRLIQPPVRGKAIRFRAALLLSWMLVDVWYAAPEFFENRSWYILTEGVLIPLLALSLFGPLVRRVVLDWVATTNTPLEKLLDRELTAENSHGWIPPFMRRCRASGPTCPDIGRTG